jgi:peptidoglycan hydrolase CwlO-like protein
MKHLLLIVLSTFLIVGMFTAKNTSVLAEDVAGLTDKKNEIEELQAKLDEIQGQKQTLAKTISYINTKIQLAQKQIENTEAEIGELELEVQALSGKIEVLDVNLETLSEILVNRINTTYKKTVSIQPMYLLLSSDGLGDFLKRYKYLKVGQKHDRQVMFELEKARTNFDEQKKDKEQKQLQLESAKKKLETQKVGLAQQQNEKQAALQLTRNDEVRYQAELKRAMAELEAIQSIIAGKGKETESGSVKEGDVIASVIAGPSACSNGAHLHFEVVKDGKHLNPASYLSSKDITWDNKPDEPFGFSGSWNWPIREPIRLTQGYGMTFYAGTLRYYGGSPHTGIDVINSNKNYDVLAVKPGKLYRGAIGCGGGTLRYVRVDHGDGFDTYYLHINY